MQPLEVSEIKHQNHASTTILRNVAEMKPNIPWGVGRHSQEQLKAGEWIAYLITGLTFSDLQFEDKNWKTLWLNQSVKL